MKDRVSRDSSWWERFVRAQFTSEPEAGLAHEQEDRDLFSPVGGMWLQPT